MDRLEVNVAPGQTKLHKLTGTVLYYGFRPGDTVTMHKDFIKTYKGGLTQSTYPFNFPP